MVCSALRPLLRTPSLPPLDRGGRLARLAVVLLCAALLAVPANARAQDQAQGADRPPIALGFGTINDGGEVPGFLVYLDVLDEGDVEQVSIRAPGAAPGDRPVWIASFEPDDALGVRLGLVEELVAGTHRILVETREGREEYAIETDPERLLPLPTDVRAEASGSTLRLAFVPPREGVLIDVDLEPLASGRTTGAVTLVEDFGGELFFEELPPGEVAVTIRIYSGLLETHHPIPLDGSEGWIRDLDVSVYRTTAHID